HTRSKRDWSSDVCSSDLQSREDLVRTILTIAGFGFLSHKNRLCAPDEVGMDPVARRTPYPFLYRELAGHKILEFTGRHPRICPCGSAVARMGESFSRLQQGQSDALVVRQPLLVQGVEPLYRVSVETRVAEELDLERGQAIGEGRRAHLSHTQSLQHVLNPGPALLTHALFCIRNRDVLENVHQDRVSGRGQRVVGQTVDRHRTEEPTWVLDDETVRVHRHLYLCSTRVPSEITVDKGVDDRFPKSNFGILPDVRPSDAVDHGTSPHVALECTQGVSNHHGDGSLKGYVVQETLTCPQRTTRALRIMDETHHKLGKVLLGVFSERE